METPQKWEDPRWRAGGKGEVADGAGPSWLAGLLERAGNQVCDAAYGSKNDPGSVEVPNHESLHEVQSCKNERRG
jgi:hypothetical protein